MILFEGTPENDYYTNVTDDSLFAYGYEGDDIILGNTADDSLYGGSGDDVLFGRSCW